MELRTKVERARGVGGVHVALIDAPGDDGLRLAYGLRYFRRINAHGKGGSARSGK